MNTSASTPLRGSRSDDLSAALVAFATDEATTRDIAAFARQLGVLSTHILVGGLDEVIDYLSKAARPPERLIVDISGLAEPLDELDHLAQACDPSVLVYVLGERNDVTLYRGLLQMGVRDYRYKPLTLDAFRSWLEDDDGQPVRRARSGKVIAVSGTRGGLGVTTLACNLARQLVQGRGQRRVLVLDTNFYGGTAPTLMGFKASHALPDMLQNAERLDAGVLERTLVTEDNRLFLLGAQQNHADNFNFETGMMRNLLEVLAQHFHYVVVDLARPGGMLANEVFSMASTACVVSDRSIFSVNMLARMVVHIEARSRPPAVHIVVNNTRTSVRGQLEGSEFQQAIPKPITFDIPYDAKHVVMAEDLGEVLPTSSEFLRATVQLAGMITGEGAHQASRKARRGWFRRG